MVATVDRHGRGWRVRYVGPDGRRVVETGFRTEKTATDHGRRQEIAIADGSWVDPRQAHTCFSDYIDRWIAAQDLEPTTLATYRSLIRNQIKPSFGHWPTGDLDTTAVRTWIAGLRDAGFSESTVRAARRVLHTICEDAVAERLIVTNPARIPRRRGRVANRVSTNESLWAEPEQARAIALRLRELTGRDDEYVLALTLAYTGIRWAEVVGLEATFCMPLGRNELRIEWQLAEVNGRFLRKEPKYGSVRTIPIPAFLSALLGEQLDRALRCEASDCGCGNRTYVFMGPDGGHPRRSNFARRYWRPVCDGYPAERREPGRRGKHGPKPSRRPDWDPIVVGLTPHDLRHSHKTWLIEDGIAEIAQAERLGHTVGGVRGTYSHVSEAMRTQLVAALQRRWERSLGAQQRALKAVR